MEALMETHTDTLILRNGCAYFYPGPETFKKGGEIVEGAVIDLMSSSLVAALIIDLIELPEIDLDVIRGLCHMQRKVHNEGSFISIRNLSPSGRRLFEYMGLTDFFHIQKHEDLPESN